MEEIQSPSSVGEEVGLLDLLVTLAENGRLLVSVPLLMGLCTLIVGFMMPQSFQSEAVLQADQTTASLITAAVVLDPVAAGLGMDKQDGVEGARAKLRDNIRAVVGRNGKLVTLTVSAPTAAQAKATAHLVLEKTYWQSRPRGSVAQRLEVQLAEAQRRLKNAESAAAGMLKRFEAPLANGGGELARGYADLLNAAAAAQRQIGELETQLEGLTDAQLLQAPTLPETANQPKKVLMAIGGTVGTGLLLLLFIFVRQALRNAATDAEAAGKLARIRRALRPKAQAAP